MSPSQPLPEFQSPPLIEVVLGVQFAPKPPLGTALAGLLWSRLRGAYPHVEAQPPLPPVSPDENPTSPGITFGFMAGPASSRHWFLSGDGSRLLQLQPDRFVHNWRKNDGDSVYPRYGAVRASFEEGFEALQSFCAVEGLGEIEPTVCEVTYINHIVTGEEWETVGDVGRVLKPVHFDAVVDAEPPSQFQLGFQRAISRGGSPVGRLDVASQSVLRLADNKPMILLTISAFGRPTSPDFRGVLDFLDLGHDQVVRAASPISRQRKCTVFGDPMTPTATLDQAHKAYRETGAKGPYLAPASLSTRAPGLAGAWLSDLQQQLGQLLQLPEGWDSYSAEPISRQAAWEVLRFLSVAPTISPSPALVPVNDGSLQLEWHREQIDLEIRFCADGRIEAFFEDLQTGDEWEREGWGALSDIQRTLYRLAGHQKS